MSVALVGRMEARLMDRGVAPRCTRSGGESADGVSEWLTRSFDKHSFEAWR